MSLLEWLIDSKEFLFTSFANCIIILLKDGVGEERLMAQ